MSEGYEVHAPDHWTKNRLVYSFRYNTNTAAFLLDGSASDVFSDIPAFFNEWPEFDEDLLCRPFFVYDVDDIPRWTVGASSWHSAATPVMARTFTGKPMKRFYLKNSTGEYRGNVYTFCDEKGVPDWHICICYLYSVDIEHRDPEICVIEVDDEGNTIEGEFTEFRTLYYKGEESPQMPKKASPSKKRPRTPDPEDERPAKRLRDGVQWTEDFVIIIQDGKAYITLRDKLINLE